MVAHVYILLCADGSFYVGSTRKALEDRLAEHVEGRERAYTKSRRPLELVWSQSFERHTDAFTIERQIKGWSRRKKQALIDGDWTMIRQLSRSYQHHGRPSTRA